MNEFLKQHATEIGPQNTAYTVTPDGKLTLIIETTTQTTTQTTVTEKVTWDLGSIDDLRNRLLEHTLPSLIERMSPWMDAGNVRMVLNRKLGEFPPTCEPSDEYPDSLKFAVYPDEETFIMWALVSCHRAYWQHMLMLHHYGDVHKVTKDLGLAFDCITDLAASPDLRALVNKTDLTMKQVSQDLVPIARKFMAKQNYKNADEKNFLVSITGCDNDEGDALDVEGSLGLSSNLEGERNPVTSDLGAGRQWNDFGSQAVKFNPKAPYADGARSSYNGSVFVSITDFNLGHQPDISPDFWELTTDEPAKRKPAFAQKRRRNGRLRPTAQHVQCDRFLCLLLVINGPMAFPGILAACESPFGQKTFGRKRVLASLKRVGVLESGVWRLTIASMIEGQKLRDIVDPVRLEAERQERLKSWKRRATDVKYEQSDGFDIFSDETETTGDEAPTDKELKNLYHAVLVRVHPDLAAPDADKVELEARHVMTVKANLAYDRGGVSGYRELRAILDLYAD